MASNPELLKQIETTLSVFGTSGLLDASLGLFGSLGYKSERRIKLRSSTAEGFLGTFDRAQSLNPDRALLADWQSAEFLFQLTDAEVQSASTGTDELAFDSKGKFDGAEINSFLFLAIELRAASARTGERKGQPYTRTELAGATRALNRLFDMPALLVFKHGDTISIGIIHRRLSKRDTSKDVLEKVTLIKDIAFADPIRAHVEILHDFALPQLIADYGVANFVALHAAWQKRLGSYALSNEFYREIADWYFWAHHQVDDEAIRLPQHCDTEQEKSLFLIRLLTRVIFSWFLVEKRLIPTDLFREHRLRSLLKDFNPSRDPKKPDTAPTYYHAILQNLFFGTLNMPADQRGFREKAKKAGDYDKNYGVTNLWRYEDDFRTPADWLKLASRVPFLNGGLFDCLDDKSGTKRDNSILDGFSDNPKLACHLPNDLFFGPERTVDLSRDYGEEDKRTARSKKAKVRGLIEILSRYKFTIEENTPLEEEIALDPELLGKVFENLLASYNDDTRTTARKALGAFYTPREIVSHMVDEALKSYLGTQVPRCKVLLELLFSNKPEGLLKKLEETAAGTRDALVTAIGRAKILDPACGSGAFPMGALHRLVDLLQKLDPTGEKWKELQRRRAIAETEIAFQSGNRKEREGRLKEINDTFEFNSTDYGRKLYLIENSIYGVDIQPVATQIAKLRFFIALIVDQRVNPDAKNFGVKALPNLETRLVAADTLTPLPKPKERQGGLFDDASPEDYAAHNRLKEELTRVRHEHFNARDPRKKRDCRREDERIREELKGLLRRVGLPAEAAALMANWDPYDQNTHAPFFDSEWMFGLPVGKVRLEGKAPATILGNLALINEAGGQSELTSSAPCEINSGFDVVIGNPPYVLLQAVGLTGVQLAEWRERYISAQYKVDLYQVFFEASLALLRPNGVLAFITPNTFLKNKFSAALRKLLLTESQPLAFLLFYYPVFPGQAVDNAVSIWRKRETPDISALAPVRSVPVNSGEDLLVPLRWRVTPPSRIVPPSYELELDVNESAAVVLNLIDSVSQPLGTFCGAYFGVQTFDRKRFVSSEARTKHFQPVIDGTNVKRWSYSPPNEFVDFRPTAIKSGGDPEIYAKPRIVVRQIGVFPEGCLCPARLVTLNTIYNIYENEPEGRLSFFLGIINSSLTAFYWRLRFFDNKETFPKIKKAPLLSIPIPPALGGQRVAVELLVAWLTNVSCSLAAHPSAQTTRDPLMVAYWERVLNALVYELYFPEELHAAGLRFFDLVAQAELPDLNKLPEKVRLPKLRLKFEELHDGAHPLRVALDKLQTLDIVRIIEGTA